MAKDSRLLRVDARVARAVPLLLWALSAAFAFFAVVTVVMRPREVMMPLLWLDAGGALVLAVGAWRAQRRGVAPGRANAVAAVALLFALFASLVALKLLALSAQTTNVILVALVASVVLLSPRWFAVVLASSFVGWGVVAWSEGLRPAWLNAGFTLLATGLMAIGVQFIRVRDARRSERLALALEQEASDAARAADAERLRARQLSAANDSLEAFSYVVSHDLKEPIRGLRILLEDVAADPEAADRDELLSKALQSQAQLERLVQGLLEWSRVARAVPEPEVVDVGALLNDATTRAQFGQVLQERRAKLLIDQELPRVLATPALLRQALGNLVLNAVRHNERPDAQVRVYAAPDAPEGMVDLVVEDNGPGFPPWVLARFATSSPERPESLRVGFGLSIARRAAQRLGGEVHLRNVPEGGAQAHLLLPAAQAAADAPPASAEAARKEARSRRGPAPS